MAYLCPVCSAPQADGEHLANHLAFTAMLRGEGHGEWLDEHVPEWEEMDPDGLAPEVVEHAEEDETEIESESESHGHDHGGSFEDGLAQQTGYGRDSLQNDPEAQQILAEAEELTRKMREGAAGANAPDGDEGAASANAPDEYEEATDADGPGDGDEE